MSYEITIKSLDPKEWQAFAEYVQKLEAQQREDGKPIFITACTDEKEVRSLAQNALSAVYYKAIADKFGYTVIEARLRCKVDFGLQALLQQSGSKSAKGAIKDANRVLKTLAVIKFKWLSYPDKLHVMNTLPCTRIMTSAIFCDYLKQIELFYSQHGLILESINETLRNNALNIK